MRGQVLALGGQMKAAICLTKNGQALLGHHLGELDEALTWEAFQQALADYAALFDHRPRAGRGRSAPGLPGDAGGRGDGSAADPGAASPCPSRQRSRRKRLGAGCGGRWRGSSSTGWGSAPDGTIWGGEVLLGDYGGFERVGWLKPAPLAGGDAANREPWRNALVRLDAAGSGRGPTR